MIYHSMWYQKFIFSSVLLLGVSQIFIIFYNFIILSIYSQTLLPVVSNIYLFYRYFHGFCFEILSCMMPPRANPKIKPNASIHPTSQRDLEHLTLLDPLYGIHHLLSLFQSAVLATFQDSYQQGSPIDHDT